MSDKQPSAGAVKLAREMNKRAAEYDDLICEAELQEIIDRHVAPLVEALSDISKDAWSGDVTRLRTIAQSADAALQQWKDGKG